MCYLRRHAVAADGSVTTDEDSLAKAMRRKVLLNGQLTPGTSSKPKGSFDSYDRKSIGIGNS